MKKKKVLLLLSLAMLGVAGTKLANLGYVEKAMAAEYSLTLFDKDTSDISISAIGDKNTTAGNLGIRGDYCGYYTTFDIPNSDSKIEFALGVNDTVSSSGLAIGGSPADKRFVTFSIPAGYKLTSVHFIATNTSDRVYSLLEGTANNGTEIDNVPSVEWKKNTGTHEYDFLDREDDKVELESADGMRMYSVNQSGSNAFFERLDIKYALMVETYNVTYWSADGSTQYTNLTEVVEEGSYPEVNPILDNEEGLKFLGWSENPNDDVVVDPTDYDIYEDTAFYAVWEEVATYTVTVNDNYDGAEPREYTFNDGDKLVLEDPEPREGFKFVGWYYDAEGVNEVSEGDIVDSDITVYAKWEATEYANITFKVGDEDYYSSRTFVNELLEDWPSDPEAPTGYVFIGWFDDEGNKYTTDSEFEDDITLHAEFDITPVQYYNFTDYVNKGVITSAYDDGLIVEEGIIALGAGKTNTDAAAGTHDGMNLSTYAQASRLYLTLAKNAEVTIYVTQTSDQNRRLAVKDNEGYSHITYNRPANKKSTGDAIKQTLTLEAGTYEIFSYEVGSASFTGSFNFYGVKIDYTNNETITSELASTESAKLNSQSGHSAEGKNAMRFVGEINNIAVKDILSIRLNVSVSKAVEIGAASETLFNDYIYVVYDNVDSKYNVVDNRLYFEYIVDVEDDFLTVSCEATISLRGGSGSTFKVTNTFDCVAAFGE